MKLNHIIAAALMVCPLAGAAQDINTEITIEREVVPEQRAAARPDILPRLQLPQVSQAALTMADRSDVTSIPPYMSRLEPASFGNPVVPEQGRGYVSGGYLPVYNLDLSAGYRLLQTERSSADVFGQFNGRKYSHLYRNSFMVGAGFETRTQGGNKFKAIVDFGHSRFNRYDYMGNIERLSRYSAFDLALDYTGRITPDLDFSVGFDADMAGYKTRSKMSEDGWNTRSDWKFGLNAGLDWRYNEISTWEADVKFNAIIPSMNCIEPLQDIYGPDNIVCFKKMSLRFTPGYHYSAQSFDARLGLAIDGMFLAKDKDMCNLCQRWLPDTDAKNKVMLSPDIRAAWMPSGSFSIWAAWSGRGYDNFMGDVYNAMPDADMYWLGGFSRIPVDIKAGVNFGPWKGASLQVRAGYVNVEDWLMPDGLGAGISAMDLESFMLGGEFRYDYRSLLSLDVAYDRVLNDEAYYLWRDGAKAQFRAAVTVRPIQALNLKLSWLRRTGRHAQGGYGSGYGYGYGYGSESGYATDGYGQISSLDFSAGYTVNKRLGLFLNLENLLCKRWLLVGGLPSQRLHGLIGATYTF